MPQQLPLALWPDSFTLDNFYVGDNVQALAWINEMVVSDKQRCIYLYGQHGVGLSHLLYAACHAVQQKQGTAVYLPLSKLGLSPQMLEGLENLDLICWDDLETIAGNRPWEEALFHCYNRVQSSGSRLLIAAHAPPAQIAWALPDLGSRLAAGVVFAIKSLSDEQKIRALHQRAVERGLELTEEVGRYLLQHSRREMRVLFDVLDKLDLASLSAQRRLTVPLLKEVLGSLQFPSLSKGG